MRYRLSDYIKKPKRVLDELIWTRTRLTSAYKRARYGYSAADMSIYGYDGTLMTWTGKSMMELTRYKTGCPGSYVEEFGEDECFDAWNNDLCFYGMCLVVGGDTDHSDEAIAWAKEAFPDLWEKARTRYIARQYNRVDDLIMYNVSSEIGRIGLVWLSEHYMSLWD